MKRFNRFVLLTLGYLLAIGRVAVRRFKRATRVQRRKTIATSMVVAAALGAFAATSANAANELGYNSTVDYSLTFDGTNPIQVADPGTSPTDFTTNFTMEAWVKPGACTATRCMIGNKENSWEWAVYNGAIEYAIVTNAGGWAWVATTALLPSNSWSHVAWVKNGTAMKFYVNGALADDTKTTGQTTTASNDPFTIGGRVVNADRYIGGMDEHKLWNTARTAAQIANDMHSYGDGVGPNFLDDSSLVGYYDFNEGTNASAQIFDRTTNAKHVAVVSGATKPTYSDIKTTAVLGGDTVYTFPRSYITPVGGWTAPTGATRARVLVIAGGGAGGPGQSSGWNGPGGGAGGMRDIPTASMSGVMKVTVGQGGFAAPTGAAYSSTSGQDSFFGSESSVGGGGGLYWAFPGQGQNGGSGSGAMMFGGGSTSAAASGGTGIAGQGNAGGKNAPGSVANTHYGSGGGGGAGSAGGNASAQTGGAAGNGALSNISGVDKYYAGGGAGAGYTTQGAANTTYAATPVGTTPTANTGSGGAGGRNAGTEATPGASGVVIVRYSPQVDSYLSRTSQSEARYQVSSAGPIPTGTTDAMTLEAWIRPKSHAADGYYAIMAQQTASDDNWGTSRVWFGMKGGILHFILGSQSTFPAAKIPDNAWTHVAVTVSGSNTATVKIYIDSQLVYFYNSWSRTALGSYFAVGASPQLNDYDWLGDLDQVKIWNSALSEDEIKASMNAYQAPGTGNAIASNLKVHYDFNEVGTSNALLDRSSVGGASDASTSHTSPSFVENIETASKSNARNAIRFTRNYLTAAGGWTVPAGAARVDALVVAGGGGGGAHVGGGGGAGGFIEKPVSLSPGSVIPIQVGQGGGGGMLRETTWTQSGAGEAYVSRYGSLTGNNSILGSAITANGGGRGANWAGTGETGGSGGGSNFVYTSGGAAIAGQGNAGGYSSGATYNGNDPYVTGGGGGAGGVGGSPSSTTFTSGAGGIGKISNLWSSNTYYAGGGGGGFHTGGTGGAGGTGGGGAGQGGFTTATILTPGSGTPNTGGGGGGSGAPSGAGYHSMGGNGGSGVIVLSYGGYLDLSNTPKARRATQQFDVAPIIKIKNNDGSQLSGSSHTVTVTTGTIGNLTFNGTALSAPKTITASDGVFDFTGLGFAAGVTTAQELTFTSPDFVDLQVTVAPKFNPTSVQIVADASAVSTAGYFDSTGQFYADAAASTNIRVSDLNAAIASTDVRIDATGTISVDTGANTSASANALTMVAGTTLTISTGNSLRTGGATSLTGTSVSINGPLTTSGTTLIYSNSTTGVNTIAADVKNLGLNARTTFKSVGANSNTTAATIQTNKGALVFWADSDGSLAGFNRTQHGSIFNTVNGTSTDTATDGGDIVFAGGSTTDASDYPSSASWADGTYSGFDSGYGNTNKTFYYTGGGDFIVRGNSGNSLDAVAFQSAVQVWANSGQIDITGRNTSNGLAIQIQRSGSTTQSEFFSSSATAPAIAFTALANSGYGFLTGNNLSTANVINIQATGAGGISIVGNGGGADVFDIGINSTNILSAGPITMTTQGVGVNGGLFPGRLFNNYASTFSTLGYCATATCTGSRVTSSSANITVNTDRVASWDTDVNLKVNTAGDVIFRPTQSTGFHEFKSRGQGLAFSEDASSVIIGKDQTTDTYTLEIYSNIKINGPIRLYGGNVGVYGNLESTRAGGEIRAKSNGRVYVYLSKTVKTNGGDVVFWSNADKVAGVTAVAGTIWLEDSSSIATNGGKIWLAGGLDDGGADASITASRGKWASVDAADGLPDGYAVGSNEANEWAIGVYLDASASLKSAGGDIFIAGAHGPTSNIGYAHILVKPGVVIDSGTGRVAMWAKSPVGSNVGTQGIALTYGSDSTPVVITSHAPTADAITIYSDSSESSGSWSRGVTAAWNGAYSATRGYQGVHILATAAQGGITMTGIGGGGSGSSDAVGLRLDYIDILAKSGPIILNGLSSSSASSQGLSVGRDNGGNSALRLGGWQAGTTGAAGGGSFVTSVGTTDFTTSTSPVTINIDSAYMYEGGKGTIFGTTGAVNILPITNVSGIATATANFKRAQTDAQWRFGQTSFPIAAASFTLGSTTTTTDIAYYGAVTSSGPITLHGGNLTVAGNLTGTGLDERVLLKAKVSIAQTSASTIRTNSGKIVLWADSDNSSGGNMTLAGTLCSAPTATTCNTSATTGGDDIILGGGAADANDSTLPGGYASGTGTGSDVTASGIQLGTMQVANSGTKIFSSGGNIKIQSQTVSSASAISAWALGLVVVSGTEVNSGAGEIDINVVVAAPSSTSFMAAAEFNAWGGGTTKFISTNAASDSISIKVNNPSGAGSSKVFGSNAGTSFTNANGGGLLLQTNWVDPALKATLAITGPVVIEPVATSFVNDAINLDSDYTISANPAGLRIGKPGNTIDVTVGVAVTSTGAIQVYGGNVTANADLKVTNANEILLKAMDDVVVGAGTDAATRRVVSTYGGSITLWSNANFSGTGAIVTNNFTSFLSRGAKITMAGSASVNEVSPTGFAVGSASTTSYKVSTTDKAPGSGVRLASSAVAGNLTISSDGGDIVIQGSTSRNVTDGMGVLQYGGSTIDAGAGAIKIHARTSSTSGTINGHGMELGFAGTAPTLITSSKSSDTAIDINGQTSGTSSDGKGVNFWSGDATNYVKISATGAAGNVSLTGSATTTTQPGISMNWARVLSKGGSVTLDSGVNPTAFGNNSASGNIYLGADSAAGASGNVDINAGSITWAGTVNVRTTGDLSIDSGSAQSFNAEMSVPSGSLVLAEVNDIRIGTAGTSGATQNSANVTVSSALSGSGNTAIYGGIVTAAANITGTGLDGSVLLKATGSIVQNVSTTIRTNSGKTVIWSDSDEANGGTITLKGAVCTAPTATTCSATAVTGGDDVIVGGGAPSASDASIPGGYASGTSAGSMDTASGVMFGTTGVSGGSKIYSSGGNVNVAGRTFVTSGTISVFAIGVIFMAETEIHAGLGKIFVEGNNATAAATAGNYRYPLEWNGWGLNKTSQFTSTNADDDSITMRAVETVASNGLHINTGGAEFKNPNGGLLIQTNRFMDTTMATVNVGGPFVFEPVDTSFAATYTFDSDITWGANVPSAVRIGKSGNTAGITVTQTVRSSGDIAILGGALSTTSAVSSTGGTITYTGASFSNSGVLSTDGQDILVNADQVTIGASITTNKTTAGIVSLVPKTASKNIDLGAADSGSLLGLTDAELDFVKGKVLRVGNVSYANNINVSANISIDSAKAPTLALRGAGNVTTSNTATINATNLAIAVSGTVSLGGANQISGNLAITAGGASAGSGVSFGGASFTPGSADSIDAIFGVGKNISISSAPAIGATEVRYLNQTWSAPPVVTVKDEYGITISAANSSKSSYTTTVTDSGAPTVAGATPVLDGGVQTFSNLKFTTQTGSTDLTFTTAGLAAGGTSTVTTGTYEVQAGEPAAIALTYDATEAPAGKTGFAIRASLKDAGGNTVSGPHATDAITVDVTDGDADATNDATIISGNTPATVAGVANFSNLKLGGKVSTNYTLTFTVTFVDSTGATQAVSETLVVTLTPGDATTLKVQTAAAGFSNRTAFSTQPAVAVKDAYGNTVTTSNASVSVAVAAVGAASTQGLSGTLSATANSGVATFVGLGKTGLVGAKRLTFSANNLSSDTQDFTLTYGAANKLAMTSPASTVNDTIFGTQPVVTIQDQDGNTVADSTATVTLTSSNATIGGALLNSAVAMDAVAGVADFSGKNVKLTGTIGAKNLTATITGGITLTNQVSITFGVATKLVLSRDAADAVNAVAFVTQPQVVVQDISGNVVTNSSASITVESSGSTLSGNSTPPTLVNGVATFSGLKLTGTKGTYVLTFKATGLTDASQNITVAYGAATKLALTTSPLGFVNRTNFSTQPVITVQDVSGNTVENSAVSIDVAIDSGTLTGTTQIAAVNGIATFSGLGKYGTVGAKTLTFTKTGGGLTQATFGFTLTYGAVDHLALTAPSTTPNDKLFVTQPVVTIQDADNNTVADSTLNVTLTATGATIGGNASMDAVAGVADFAGKGVKLTGTTGSKVITAAATGATSATSNVTITYGAATKLAIVQQAAGAVNGVAFTTQPKVVFQDVSNNTVDTTDSIDAATSAGATLAGTASVAAVSGKSSFTNLKLTGTVGTYTLTFTSGSLTSAQQTIPLTFGAATQLALTTQPVGFVNRTNFTTQPVITVQDASGNTVTNASISIDVAIDSGALTGTTQVRSVNGVATFSGLGKTGVIGSKTLSFTKTGGGLTAATFGFTLTYGAVDHLAMTSPSTSVNDRVFSTQPVVTIQDADNNIVADSTLTVTLTASGATLGGTLQGGNVAMDAVAGVADFSGKNVKLTGSIGAKNLTATIAGGITVTNSVTVTAGAATKLAIVQQAAGAVNAVAFTTQPQVVFQDVSGNTVDTTDSIDVAASGSTLSGATSVAAVSGKTTFTNLKLTGSTGTYVLTFSSGALTSDQQNITVAYGAATKLVLTTSPLGFVNRTNFSTQPVITVQDVSGNTVENSSVSIDVAIDSGTLTGTTQIATVNGIATFSGLGKYGTVGAKTLTFAKTGGGLTQATFGFTLTYGAIHHLNVNVAGTLINDTAWATQPIVAIQDEDNNTVDVTDTVTLTATGATTVVIGGTTSMQTTNGLANFTGKGVKLTGLVGSKTLTATITSGNGFAKDTAITLTYGAATKLALTTEPTGFVNRTLFSTQPVVTVQDVSGNTVANSVISIDVAVDNGGVSGTTQVAAVAGVATFSGLGKTGTIGAKVLTFSDAANALTPATKSFTLTHGAAYRVGMVVASTLVNATAFATAPVVTIYDQDDNIVTSGSQSNQTVTLSATGATAVALGGAVTMDAFDGVADFSGKRIKLTGLVGVKSLTATISSPASIAKTETVTLTYGAATKLAISTDAADASNGGQFGTQPVILVQDVSGNLVTNSTVQVVASVSNGTLDGTDTLAAIGGVATFTDLGLTATAGSKTLTFSSSPLTAVSQSILAVTGAPSQLRIDVAGSLINNTVFATQPVVTLLDATGNVVSVGGYATQTVTLSSPDATIGGTVSMQSSTGVANFTGKGVKLTGLVGARSLVATISSPNNVTATASVTITFGAAHHLNIASAASGAANRLAFTSQPAIEVLDISGNRVDDSTAQISVAATGANGAVLGGDTSMNATAGVAYFNLNANKLKLTGQIGTYTLTYSSGVLSADSEDIELTHGVATKIVVSRVANGAKAGQAFNTQPKVQIQDADSNLVTTGSAATASIRMAVSADAYDSAAHTGVNLVGPANFATVSASAGEATFAGARLEGVVASAYPLNFEVVNTAGFNGLAVSQNIALTAGTETHLEVVQQPTAIIAGAAFSPAVTVEILDAWNNRVLDVANTVTVKPTLVDDALASNALDASKTAVANSTGLVTFTGLTFTKAGNQFIQFTSTGLVSTTSVGFIITNAVAHHLVWVTSPVGARNDFAIKGAANANPELEIRDQYENPVLTGSATSVDVTEITSSADVISISGSSARNAAGSARVVFHSLVMRAKVGSYNLRFTAANGALPINGTFIDSNAAVAISFGEPAALRLTRNAAGANAGAPFTTQPKLNIEDTAGNLVADSTLSATVSETETQVLGGTATRAAAGGSIDFTDSGLMLSGAVANGLTLKYAITFNSIEISTTQSINLNPGLAVDLTIGQQPTTVKTRVAFNPVPTVVLRDASGNQVTSDSSSTVTAQLKDAGGNPVGAETAAFTAAGGLVTFTGLSFQAPSTENYFVTFKLVSNSVSKTSTAFDILPGVATELRITRQPSTDALDHTPGKTGELLSTQPVVKLYDQDGNLVTTANSGAITIRVQSTDGAGDLSEGAVTANISAGIATFAGVKFVGTPGVSYTLDFASATPNPALTSVSSQPISVTHNDATQLVVTRAAAGGRSGEAFSTPPIVTIQDRYGNTVKTGPDANRRITVTGDVTAPTAGSANLSSASASASNGVATFNALTLTGSIANTYRLNFSIVGSSITSASQSNLTISYGYESQIAIATQPVGGNATGTHLTTQPVIEIRDSAGNLVADSTFAVVASINSTAGLTLADGSAARLTGATKSAVGGIATFDALDLYGLPGTNYELKFLVSGLPFTTANPIQVTHAAAHHLTITQQPTGGNATGSSLTGQPTVELRDAFENVVTSNSANVITARLSTTSARERLEGNSTVTLANGVGAFAGLKVVALPDTDYSLDFTTTVASNALTSASTNTFRVTYSTPTQLAVVQEPSGGTTGVALNTQPIIEVQDVYGNRVYNYVGNVAASVSAGATLTNSTVGNSSLSLAVASGRAAFSGLAVTGTPLTDYQLTFASGALTSANSATIRVTPGAPVRIVILNQPIGAQNRAALAGQPVVEVQDSFGNRVTQDSSTVITAALTSGADGTLTRVVSSNSVAIQAAVSNGVATFSNLYMRGLTNRNYRMTFSSGNLVAAESANFSVNHAAVANLIWNTQPTVGMTGSALTRAAVLELQDLDGNIADTDNSTVVTAVITSGVGGTLANATATAVNGVVTFTNLTVTGTPGVSYKLTFSGAIGGSTVTATESNSLTPTHAVPAKVTMRGGNVTGGLTGENLTSQPTLYVRDRFNNIATSDNSTVVTASILTDVTGTVSGNVTATAVNGEVTFAGLKVSGTPGTPYTLRFAADSSGTTLTTADSNSFTVSKVARVDLAYTAQAYSPNAVVPVQFSTDSPGDITFSTNASATVCTLNRGTGDLTIKGVGNCLVRVDLDTDLDGFYLANFAEATLVISKAPQAPVTLTSAATVDYWSSLNPVATGGSGTGALSYSVVTGSTCRLIGATILPGDAGSLCQITATRAGDDNYLPATSAVQTIEVRKINQATLTIASSQTIDAVDTHTLFTAGGSGTGAVTYSIVSSGTARCRLAAAVLTATANGTCTIRAAKAGSTNYNPITSASQTVTVNLEEQTVAFTSTAPMYPVVSGSYTPVATATSGLAVTFSIATNNSGVACAFDSTTPGKVNFVATGVCELVATQAGSSRYAFASVRQMIRVGLLNQTITFEPIPELRFGTPAFRLLPTSNAGIDANVTLATTSNSTACSISGDIVTLNAAGYCEISANQAGYGAYAAATEVIRGFNVLADFAGAPRIFSTSVTTHALTASFTAPSYTGGSPIIGFALIATDSNGQTYENAACPVSNGSISCTIVGLPNDIAYTAVARAITSAGLGAASNVTAAQTPTDAPVAVTNLAATTSNNDLVVTWSPPNALDGTFQRYDIFIAPLGSPYPATTPYNVTDVNATSTTIQNVINQAVAPTSAPTPSASISTARVSFRRASVSSPAPSASNSAPSSSSSNSAGFKVQIVTITSASTTASNTNTTSGFQTNFSVPLSPSQLTLTVTGDDLMTSWSAPTADGGSPVIGYDVKVNGAVICSATTSLFCQFNGMQPGRTYSVEVLALNAIGPSVASAASHSVAALAPVAGSGGAGSAMVNGMAILSSSTKTALTTGGQLLTLNARNFADITSALLDGKPLKIVSNSEDHITLELPAHEAGSVSIVFKSKLGTLVFQDAVTFVAPPRADVRQTYSRYLVGSVASNSRMAASIKAVVVAKQAPKAMVCVGLVPAKYTANDVKLAKLRAANVCAMGAKFDGKLAVRATTGITKLTGPAARAVVVTYKY